MRYDYFDTGCIGTLTLAGDEQGLRRIDFETARRPMPVDPSWRHDRIFFRTVREPLAACFHGELRRFDLALAPDGKTWNLAQAQRIGKDS
jgi:hypothetical protein